MKRSDILKQLLYRILAESFKAIENFNFPGCVKNQSTLNVKMCYYLADQRIAQII